MLSAANQTTHRAVESDSHSAGFAFALVADLQVQAGYPRPVEVLVEEGSGHGAVLATYDGTDYRWLLYDESAQPDSGTYICPECRLNIRDDERESGWDERCPADQAHEGEAPYMRFESDPFEPWEWVQNLFDSLPDDELIEMFDWRWQDYLPLVY